jgi:3-deoxy-D-manno-octulosonic acid (KDO) 8-phosphate synthase
MKLGAFDAGPDRPFFLIAGPCVIESEQLVIEVAGRLRDMTTALGINFIFKASFDKANRSSKGSFRGPGIEAGLKALGLVRKQIGVPVLTDVHEDTPLGEVASVVDVMQTPAFLCRQTNFIVNVSSQNKPVNIKKGQFLSPWEMQNVVDKAKSTGNTQIMVCERGSPPASREFSWKPIRILPRHCPMVPMPGRWIAWDRCSPRWWSWIWPSKRNPSRSPCYESHCRYPRPRNYRFAWQSHR